MSDSASLYRRGAFNGATIEVIYTIYIYINKNMKYIFIVLNIYVKNMNKVLLKYEKLSWINWCFE